KTSEDFGDQGEPPIQPELFDHLTTRFVESGWDVKALMRYMVSSETYQQSSRATPEQYLADPDNRLLARGSRYRFDAEVIRDQVLSVCGLLNTKLYGKSVKTPQPDGLWKIVAMPSSYPNVFKPDAGAGVYRRSVYSFWKRGLPPPQMTIFDAPTRESCVARRERTNTPLQALVLMNEENYFAAAMHFAGVLTSRAELSDRDKIDWAYESITSQALDDADREQLLDGLSEFRTLYVATPDAATQMIEMVRAAGGSGTAAVADPVAKHSVSDGRAELAAWTMLVHSLLNLDAVRNRE
ncbi:MAG: DUF1553 domain-containing protein, partial [Planctomycetota bacterium]